MQIRHLVWQTCYLKLVGPHPNFRSCILGQFCTLWGEGRPFAIQRTCNIYVFLLRMRLCCAKDVVRYNFAPHQYQVSLLTAADHLLLLTKPQNPRPHNCSCSKGGVEIQASRSVNETNEIKFHLQIEKLR